MKILTDRKLAEQEKVTFDTQRLAEETRKELEQAEDDAKNKTESKVIKLKTDAVGQANYATIEVGRALATSGFKLVPDVIAGGGPEGGSNGIINVLMAGMLKDSMNGHSSTPKSPKQ